MGVEEHYKPLYILVKYYGLPYSVTNIIWHDLVRSKYPTLFHKSWSRNITYGIGVTIISVEMVPRWTDLIYDIRVTHLDFHKNELLIFL